MKALLGLFILCVPVAAVADVVVPVDSVQSFVNVRAQPDAGSDVVGQLGRGDELTFVRTVDGWHEVRLADGETGFVHADWGTVIETPGTDVAMDAQSADGTAADNGMSVDAGGDDSVAEAAVTDDAVPPQDTAPAEDEAVSVGGAADAGSAQPPPAAPAISPLKGRKDFVVRFRDESTGTSSQIFDDGNFVGIGTTEPEQRLEVNGSIRVNDQNSGVAGLMITQASGDTGYILHNRASTLTIGAGSVDRVTIDRNGNVGIAVARPEHPLELASGAHATAGGVWTNSSSRERKTDIEVLDADDALDTVLALQPVEFRYRNDDEQHVGFIAEDVPELVATRDRQGLSPMDVVATLTKVVQLQQQRIAELEARLTALEQ